jgi:hypothetical protein
VLVTNQQDSIAVVISTILLKSAGIALSLVLLCQWSLAQQPEKSLEQRQPLELVFADSIVPQDRHELMSTTGTWYFLHGSLRDAHLTQKVEWGISNSFQVSAFLTPVRHSNATGAMQTGPGDFEVGARYTWENVLSPFTHMAVAFDAGFPTGNPAKGMGEGAYTLSPSVLFSHEFRAGKYQLFSTSGVEFITATRSLSASQDVPHHVLFSNNGLALRVGRGWAVGEFSIDTNRWSGGDHTDCSLTPSYVWRLARRTELLLGVPVGLTSSTDHIGGVLKFTFELGGGD